MTDPKAVHLLLAGHLGHLTSSQQESFQKFKDNLAKVELYTPPTGISKASHDEPTLLCVSCLGTVPSSA